MQKTLFALLVTLLFTGCVERGQNLRPAPVHTEPIKIKTTQAISKVKPIEVKKSKTTSTVAIKIKNDVNSETTNTVAPTHKPHTPIINKEDQSLFPLSEETKNKISGFFILVIGIIILL